MREDGHRRAAGGNATLQLGVDVGSTTVKVVLLDGSQVVFSEYRRHHAEVRQALTQLLRKAANRFPGARVESAITGSGGLSTADAVGVPFVQEVIAGTEAVRRLHPDVDVVIELGGEDAKLTYLHPTSEQRMNGTCAGGTGAFIDQMATLLHTDAAGLDTLASRHEELYPIASRCGVFAKSDLQPLINQGAAHEDLAASIFSAVATQTIAGLACGRPIRGRVMFLGGPLYFLPQLRAAYEALLPNATGFITPTNAQLYVAVGAALLASEQPQEPASITRLIENLHGAKVAAESPRLPPLFADAEEYARFRDRHARAAIPQVPTELAEGRCWLGIDAGSTTIKAVVLDEAGRIVFSHYAGNQGEPLQAAVDIVRRIHAELPPGTVIGRSCATGYGEGLIQAALRLDQGEVETMAHFRAAEQVQPEVTAVIDIGGQDMKYLRIRNKTVDSIAVNEACSSGCGSFLQTFAQTMGTDIYAFAAAALDATAPVDLGTRCTVFMNSSVKQAQKEGANTQDISAGLAYSVVRNALYKVIKLKDPSDLGGKIVAQGGTFLNDSVLRAFELLTQREVVRPNIAGLMGAYGAAITARQHDDGTGMSTLVSPEELEDFSVQTTRKTCRLCQNHCQMTISTFANGDRHVTGNRCERGASLERVPPKSSLPNLYEWKQKRIFGYRRLTPAKATRGDMGIPRVLNMYENFPFWFTFLTELKFRVMLSARSTHGVFERGMESIPSENVCYPAKLVHGHIEALLDRGVNTIFYPSVSYEQELTQGADNNYNCPVVATYPEVIRGNVERLGREGVRFIAPFLNLANRDYLPARLREVFADWEIPEAEIRAALDAAWAEDAAVKEEIAQKGAEAVQWLRENKVKGVVLAGRPYHLDPAINHGIPEVINGLGMGVLTEDSVADNRLRRPLRVRDQWSYHSRLYEAAARVGDEPDLQMVQLNSFGCGLDAITAEQVEEILEGEGKVHTVLKIDEISNLGAARIRLRSLEAAVLEKERGDRSEQIEAYLPDPAKGDAERDADPDYERPPLANTHYEPPRQFTKEMREDGWEILAPQMSPIHFKLLQPVLRKAGLNIRLLERTGSDTMETGLKYVNNDACYPAVVVIGQLLQEFVTGRSDPNRTAVAITQTGGMCRATNYAALLRKGLRDAGYPQVPVIAASAQSLEANSGFSFTPSMVHRGIQAFVLGDMLQAMTLRVRPYEAARGAADALYGRWDAIFQEWLTSRGRVSALGRRLSFAALVDECVREFDRMPLSGEARRPRVGVVGEILVKFHPDANNHAVEVIESEGCEAVLPGLMQFFHYAVASGKWNHKNLGLSRKAGVLKHLALKMMELYETPVGRAFGRTGGKFVRPTPISQMAEKSVHIASMGNQAGEGWYLTAEMVDMIEQGCPNIICVQPFACLPNHIVGKGMFRPLRNEYPQANVVSIDFDPGASEVNQLNRIKLMISTAMSRSKPGSPAQTGKLDWGPVFTPERPGATSCASGCGSKLPSGKPHVPDRQGRRPLPLLV